VEQGSLRVAAEFLGLTQPALSKSLRSLELALGARLIQRNARGCTLTVRRHGGAAAAPWHYGQCRLRQVMGDAH
jgi:hypothetical protein